MVEFKAIRLSGFKSFVDPIELDIQTGITGIVGPNGCGKSNLVEALRWVMGETSAKRMRGSEMDDVIFAGTANRPSRNLADVTLFLDNRSRKAPSQFNDYDDLEVVRRITRGQGSNFRVNGREVRARDVQLLFADASTGAHSTSIVSQGKVGALINAKPVDRRPLLEEAAGITGLHSRRHESELRLRAAETNLERLDDVIATLESQLLALKKQARQAKRYRNINAQIRRLEAILLHLEAGAARAVREKAAGEYDAAERLVAELTQQGAATGSEQALAAEALPGLRQNEAEAAAKLQRLRLDLESLEREVERSRQAMAEAEDRLGQVRNDTARAEAADGDAQSALARLSAEEENLARASAGEDQERASLENEQAALEAKVEAGEEETAALTQNIAAAEAREQTLAQEVSALTGRGERLKAQLAELDGKRAALEAERGLDTDLQATRDSLSALEAGLAEAQAQSDTTSTSLAEARGEEAASGQALRQAAEGHAKLEAEIGAIARILEPGDPEMWPALVDAVKVAAGFETALGAALGDDLEASSDEAAPVHWESLPPYDPAAPLPAGAKALSDHVEGPKALVRRLSQIGVVPDAVTGARLQAALLPGQRLVTAQGALWRWDGFTAKADAPTAAAQRLQQRNRLAELRAQLDDSKAALAEAESAQTESQERARAAAAAEAAARSALSQVFAELDQARKAEGALAGALAARDSRAAAVAETQARLEREAAETGELLTAAQAAQAEMPDLENERRSLAASRAALAERRHELEGCQSRLNRLLSESEARQRRLAAIMEEKRSWHERGELARQHLSELAERESKLRQEIDELSAIPDRLSSDQERLSDLIEEADGARKDAADSLALGEQRLAEADKAAKAADLALAAAREDRVRAEGAVEQAAQLLEQITAKVLEKLDCGLDQVLEMAEVDNDESLPPHDEVEAKLSRLFRERENIGPVNLRAEAEAEELDQRILAMQSERADLISAIAKLRQGIGSLNREGRQRLLKAFEEVNSHFTDLFVRLFGGGRAHLQLTEADDPLDAGLEIMASPPGKRLQVMSLLSGGEQALTALALLFAVFLTNPAPICVLDEVDAPLDDANVDRLCSLLLELAKATGTRFLTITHHRMTMARVDRLYGVTMSERGVSQLVSVDFEAAESLRESA